MKREKALLTQVQQLTREKDQVVREKEELQEANPREAHQLSQQVSDIEIIVKWSL